MVTWLPILGVVTVCVASLGVAVWFGPRAVIYLGGLVALVSLIVLISVVVNGGHATCSSVICVEIEWAETAVGANLALGIAVALGGWLWLWVRARRERSGRSNGHSGLT